MRRHFAPVNQNVPAASAAEKPELTLSLLKPKGQQAVSDNQYTGKGL